MQIIFINNDGNGFADTMDVTEGTTMRQLFDKQSHGSDPADYMIRVNRNPVRPDYVLQEGDRVSVTPSKIEGNA